MSFSSIVRTSVSGGCIAADVGDRYIAVSETVGGGVYDISDDVEQSANMFAQDIVTYGGLRYLALDEVPSDPLAIEVLIDGVVLDLEEWTYDEEDNGVLLALPAPDGSDVVVRWPR